MRKQRNAAAVVNGPKKEGHGRPWFNMSAKAGVGEIHIFDYIDAYGVNSRSFQKELKALGDVTVINLHINSPGGDVFEGNTIYNLLKSHKANVTVYVDGLAASIASVIAMAGDKIVMPANAMMMIHDPWTIAMGSADDMRKTAETLDKIKGTLVAAYRSKSGLNDDEIQTLMSDETWFTADEAVAMKFADVVADEVKIAAALDPEVLKKFKNCPLAFLAAIAGGSAKSSPETGRTSSGEQIEDTSMNPNKLQILALAAMIGLAHSNELTALADKLVAEKADLDKVTTELSKLKAPETAATALSAEQIAAAIQKGTADALAAENKRRTDIRAVAAQLKVTDADSDNIVTTLCDTGASVDEARAKLIEARAKLDEKTGPAFSFSGNTRTFENPGFLRDAMGTAFAARYQRRIKVEDKDPAREFMGFTIMDIMAHMANAAGIRVNSRDRAAIVRAALHTTSDFPLLLADSANKILLPEYAAAAPTYRTIAAEKTFNDFKAHKFLRLGDFPDLLEVGESGEVTRGTISESRELVTMGTFGRIVGVTRQMLINDDLSAFADLAMKAGRRVANWENGMVYAILAENSYTGPTMSDGNALFDNTNHGNYTSSGTAVNLPVELGLMRGKMRNQTGLDGIKLNIAPRFLVVGTANETAAEQVTTQTTPASAANVNRVGPSLTVVVDANVSGTKWYLFASPSDAEVLVYGSLPGQSGPRVETKNGWDVEGVELKVMRDFACGAIDYRGVTLNAGTTPS